MRAMAPDTAVVRSAGLRADGLHPLAIQVMSEAGIDISEQRSKTIGDLGQMSFDVVVTLCGPARDFCSGVGPDQEGEGVPANPCERGAVMHGAPLLLHWDVPDPAQAKGSEQEVLASFRAARDQIRDSVRSLVEHGVIAALSEGRQQLESVLDLLDDGIMTHDGVHRRVYLFNRSAERITGYKREEVIGRDCHEVFAPDGLCGSHCMFSGQPDQGVSRQERVVPFVTPDGTVRQLKLVSTTTNTDKQRPGHVVVSIRDITELSELRARMKDTSSFENMVGISKAMQDVFESVRQVAASDYPVLISGESGTGKELVARAIHNLSRRKAAPFVPVNCGALPDHILESELFGHVRGAFTGATRDRKGRFQLADKGTLFLDEVGELSPAFQVRLLRVLQEMRFEPVGGERPISVDVRVISATNRELRGLVEEGSFRDDLFYRLCVVPVSLPPLRDRTEDIPFLVRKILSDITRESGRTFAELPHAIMDVLLAYHWPGNVRELMNALRFASVRSEDGHILPHHLPVEVRQGPGVGPTQDQSHSPSSAHALSADKGPAEGGRRDKLTPEAVKRALQDANGNKAHAAKLLGVSRATLYRFLDRHASA